MLKVRIVGACSLVALVSVAAFAQTTRCPSGWFTGPRYKIVEAYCWECFDYDHDTGQGKCSDLDCVPAVPNDDCPYASGIDPYPNQKVSRPCKCVYGYGWSTYKLKTDAQGNPEAVECATEEPCDELNCVQGKCWAPSSAGVTRTCATYEGDGNQGLCSGS